MYEHTPSRAASEPAAASRRLVLQAIAYAGSATASLAVVRGGHAAVQDATPEAAAGLPSLSGTTYVGTTSDPNTFVAIVVADAPSGGASREARAYVCNAADIVEWLDEGGVTGEGDGQIDLRSATGVQLVGTLTDDAAEGEITLPTGAALTFDAPRATGFDGLYTFTLTPDGQAQGTSADGARIEARLLLSGTITLPDGESADVEWPVQIEDTADLRTIYRVEDGRRGEGKTKKGVRLKVAP